MVYNPLLAMALLGGVYLVLYLISKGKWVGDGDWILAAALGLILYYPWCALIALLTANVLACVVMLPFVIRNKNHQIYMGPFLVAGYVVTLFLIECGIISI